MIRITGGAVAVLLLVSSVVHAFVFDLQEYKQETAKALLEARTEGARYNHLDIMAMYCVEDGETDRAGQLAHELLAIAPRYENDWMNARKVHRAYIVLGRIALRGGRMQEARDYLMISADMPKGDLRVPNLSLAKELLEFNQRDAVIEYF